jgi:hypothetical protein
MPAIGMTASYGDNPVGYKDDPDSHRMNSSFRDDSANNRKESASFCDDYESYRNDSGS